MLVYLDANCFNRPFDDQRQERIHRETEAVLGILQRVIAGEDELAWSTALTLELSAHPEPEIAAQLTAWSSRAEVILSSAEPVRERVEELVSQGLGSLDAAHLSFAEAAECAALLTCDDRFQRRAQSLTRSLRVLNPVEYWLEVEHAGSDE